jgi:HK97 family phage major capsid protein
MSQIADLTALVEKMVERQGATDRAIAALRAPAARAPGQPVTLSPEHVMALMQGKSLIGNDGAGYHPFRFDRKSLHRGVGMGEGLLQMALAADQRLGRPDVSKLESAGWVETQRFRTEGRKEADGTVTKAALAEGSGITGGYIVPPQFSTKLMRLAIEDSIVRPYASVLPMTSRTMQVPSLDVTTAQTAGTPPALGGIYASWQPEAATINESEPAFRQTELTAWDLVMLCVASNQLLADNAVALDALLTQLFKQALAWFTDYAFFQGRGAGNSMPLGVLNAPATLQVTRAAAAHVRLADVATMLSKVYYLNWDNVIWAAHPSVLPELIQMTDNSAGSGAGRLVWLNPAPSGQDGPVMNKFSALFFGRPLFFTEKLPALGTNGCIGVFDFEHYLIGDRMELQIDVSPHVRFTTNQMMWRIVARLDGRPWLNGPVTLADGTFTQSPFVTLSQ